MGFLKGLLSLNITKVLSFGGFLLSGFIKEILKDRPVKRLGYKPLPPGMKRPSYIPPPPPPKKSIETWEEVDPLNESEIRYR